MQAYHRQQGKLKKRKYISVYMYSLTWSWSEHLSDYRIHWLFLHVAHGWNSSVKAAVYWKKRKRFHFCAEAFAVEVTVCPWDDGSLTAACLMQADGSLHLRCQENNNVLHCGLHPLKLWDNVSDFHCKRRQSISFSLQWQKGALKTKANWKWC